MKEKWETPRIVVEKFAPNDYISSCYQVTCITPNGNALGYVYEDTNSNGQIDSDDKYLGRAQGDGVTEFTQTKPSTNGFWTPYKYDSSNWFVANASKQAVFIYYGNKLPDTPGVIHNSWHVADPTNSASYTDISTPEHPDHS